MYYTGTPGEEVKPKSGDLTKVLNDPGQKYVLVRGLELRRLKDKDKLQNLNEIKEIGDTYMLIEISDGVRIRVDKTSVFASVEDAQQK